MQLLSSCLALHFTMSVPKPNWAPQRIKTKYKTRNNPSSDLHEHQTAQIAHLEAPRLVILHSGVVCDQFAFGKLNVGGRMRSNLIDIMLSLDVDRAAPRVRIFAACAITPVRATRSV